MLSGIVKVTCVYLSDLSVTFTPLIILFSWIAYLDSLEFMVLSVFLLFILFVYLTKNSSTGSDPSFQIVNYFVFACSFLCPVTAAEFETVFHYCVLNLSSMFLVRSIISK